MNDLLAILNYAPERMPVLPDKPKSNLPPGRQAEGLTIRYHPDQQALIDWGMYGPRDPRIDQLVWELAHDHGLRLVEIEELLLSALEQKSRVLKERVRNDQPEC